MTYSDRELEGMLSDLESDLVERKESFRGDAPDRIRQAVCAFANDLPNHGVSGVIFIGAHDDGRPCGLEITDHLLCELGDVKTDGNILPPPTIVVRKRSLRGSEMAVVEVQPADAPPVRYKGRIYVRIGPRRGIATAQDERILNEKRRSRDLPFDAQPMVSVTLDEISRTTFEEDYLPSAFAKDIVESNQRSYGERLAACKMIASADDPTPTVLGVLVLGIHPRDLIPGAYVQFLRIDGTQLSDPIIDEQDIDGPIAQIIRRRVHDMKVGFHEPVSSQNCSKRPE